MPILREVGIVKAPDFLALECLCRAYETATEAESAINKVGLLVKAGRGSVAVNPLWRVSRDARMQMLTACKELAMTPAARAHLGGAADGHGSEAPRRNKFSALHELPVKPA